MALPQSHPADGATGWSTYLKDNLDYLEAGKASLDASAAALDANKADSVHGHAIADTTGLQTALDGKSAVGHTHAIADTTGLQTALDGKASTSHTHTASNISDSTTVGRSVLTAATATAARSAIGAGTSNLAVGTGATDAKAGNYTPPLADLPAGSTFVVLWTGSAWPSRGTSRTDIFAIWRDRTGTSTFPSGSVNGDSYEKVV